MINAWTQNFSLQGLCPVEGVVLPCTLGEEGEWLCAKCGVEH